MKKNEAILKRQKYNTRFKNEDMDFMLNWTIGGEPDYRHVTFASFSCSSGHQGR